MLNANKSFPSSSGWDAVANIHGDFSGSSSSYTGQVALQVSVDSSTTGSGYDESFGITSAIRAANDSDGQHGFAGYFTAETHPGDVMMGLVSKNAFGGDSTGGQFRGLQIEATDTDVTNYGVYQLGTAAINYFEGKIGIGTKTPDYELHVDDSGSNSSVKVNGANGSDAFLRLTEESSTDYGGMLKYDGTSNVFEIGTLENDTEVPAIYIPRNSANVGIGNDSPPSVLDVAGNPYAIFSLNPDFGAVTDAKSAINFFTRRDDPATLMGLSTNKGWLIEAYEENHSASVRQDKLMIGSWNGSSWGTSMTFNMNGNVGIGTLSPTKDFHVLSEIGVGNDGTTPGKITFFNNTTETNDPHIAASSKSGGTSNDLEIVTNSSSGNIFLDATGNIQLQHSGTTHLDLASNGVVWVKRDNAYLRLKDTNGTGDASFTFLSFFDDTNTRMGYIGDPNSNNSNIQVRADAGSVWASSAVDGACNISGGGCGSDIRLKQKIEDLEGSVLDKLMRVRGVEFEWKKNPGSRRYGVIAQNVEKVFPTLVREEEFGEHSRPYKTVNYNGIVAPIIEAIKELKTEKDAEIAALEDQTEALRERVAALEERQQALIHNAGEPAAGTPGQGAPPAQGRETEIALLEKQLASRQTRIDELETETASLTRDVAAQKDATAYRISPSLRRSAGRASRPDRPACTPADAADPVRPGASLRDGRPAGPVIAVPPRRRGNGGRARPGLACPGRAPVPVADPVNEPAHHGRMHACGFLRHFRGIGGEFGPEQFEDRRNLYAIDSEFAF